MNKFSLFGYGQNFRGILQWRCTGLFVLLLLLTGLLPAQTLWQEDFETDGNGSRYTSVTEFNDGGNDHFQRTDGSDITNATGPYTGQSGTFYFACEDTDDTDSGGSIGDGNDYKKIDFNQINSTGWTNLQFSGLFAVGNSNPTNTYDYLDGAVVSYSTDGGSTYTQALKFRYDNDQGDVFNEDLVVLDVINQNCLIQNPNGGFPETTDCDAEVPFPFTNGAGTLSQAFAAFTFNIPDGSTTLDIRIELAFDASNEEFAFDNFMITGTEPPLIPVCPTVASLMASASSVCDNETFDLTASGLADLASADNMDMDYGIEFVSFTSTPGDPYTGGTSLGTVPFGSLTAGNTTAILSSASIMASGNYEIYAILSPAPADMTCRPSAMTTLEILAAPFVFIEVGGDFCDGDAPFTIDAAVGPTGGTFSGPGVTDNGNGMDFTFDPGAAGLGMITITYTFTAANGCTNSATGTVTVVAGPMVSFTALADLCITDGVQTGLSGGLPFPDTSATGGMGVYSGPGVTDNGNGVTYSFDPAAAGVGVSTLTYTFTDGNGCAASASDDVEVLAIPTVTFTALADLCSDASVQVGLGGGMPTGGVYSGPGVTDDGNGMTYSFDPIAAGVGVSTITYTVGISGCDGMAMDDVEVFDLPSVTLTLTTTEYCVDDPIDVQPVVGQPTGGTYSGPGVSTGGVNLLFDPAAAGVGVHTVVYTFTDMNGCTNTDSEDITVFDLPTVSFTALADVCINDGVQMGLGGGSPTGGTYSGAGVTDDGNGMTYNFDPAAAGVGVTTITYTFTDDNTCTNSATDDVEVLALPTATFTAPADLCIDAGVQAGLGGGMPTGGVYSGPGVTDDGNGMTYSFDPMAAGAGVQTITYSVGISGCDAMASDDIEVFALPTVTLQTAPYYCLDAPLQGAPIVGGAPNGGVYSGPGVTDNGNGISYSFDPVAAGLGTATITYTFTDMNGCTSSATSTIDVLDCDFDITDPCSCLDNATVIDLDAGTGGEDGQFSELISITDATTDSLPAGQSWTVTSATGAFDAFNVPAIGMQSAGVPVAVGEALAYNLMEGTYELPFVHVDSQRYTITIEGPFPSGSPANVSLTISNICEYPDPTFDPLLESTYCSTAPVVTLGGADQNGVAADMITFTIDGNPATELDPGALSVGPHTVVMTFDGADDGNNGIAPMSGAASPGCTQTIQQEITIVLSNLAIMCPADTTIDCDVDISPASVGIATAMDDCDPNPIVTFADVTNFDGCGGYTGTVTRTWTATNALGTTATCAQVIMVQDTTAPTFTVPMGLTIDCSQDPLDLTLTGDVTDEADNCDMGGAAPVEVWINELHYDNAGGDVGEFVEIAGTAGTDLSAYSIVLYNGNGGASYNTEMLMGTLPDEGATGFGALSFAIAGIQNGAPDGLALVLNGTQVVQFLSYEGSFTATNGPANGQTSTDIGVEETGGTPIGESLQLCGTGSAASDFTWTAPAAESPGSLNGCQTLVAPPPPMGLEATFFDAIAPACGNTGVITRTWQLQDACGNLNEQVQIITIEDNAAPTFTIPADLTIECDQSATDLGLTGSPSMLMDNCDPMPMINFNDVEDLSGCGGYTGTISREWTATDVCGNTAVQTQVITIEDTTPPIFTLPEDITLECTEDPTDLTLTGDVTDAADNCTGAAPMLIWINELHYDNNSTDVGEFVEIAGTAGFDLTGTDIVLYNGNGGAAYNTVNLSGVIPDQSNGFGVLSFPIAGIQNGSPDGLALVTGTNVIEFLSYEGSFTATDGPANGLMAMDIGVSEPGGTAIGNSLQKRGTGSASGDFVWLGPLAESPGAINDGQTFIALPTQMGPTVSFVDTPMLTGCGGTGTISRAWTVTDDCGNAATLTQTITVEDTTPPIAVCQDITVELDENGVAMIMASDLDGGSSDACGTLSFSASQTSFDCSDLGPSGTPGCSNTLPITLTVTDDCGNSSTCIANVIIKVNLVTKTRRVVIAVATIALRCRLV
ncbi:MAG: hypothetical protein AAFR05_10365, partial [Bacteroidota bacterium]